MENTTESPVKAPSQQERAQILMQYWGQQVCIKGWTDKYNPILFGAEFDANGNYFVRVHYGGKYFPVDKCSVPVKKLSAITQEHKISLMKAYYGEKFAKIDPAQEFYWLEVKKLLTLGMPRWIADHLREWGYATMYNEWNISELTRLGIYKITE